MMELSTQELTKYIQQIKNIEVSLYEQKKCYDVASRELVRKDLKKMLDDIAPKKKVFSEPKRPQELPSTVTAIINYISALPLVVKIIMLVATIPLSIISLYLPSIDGIFRLYLLAIVLYFVGKHMVKQAIPAVAAYEEALKRFEEASARAEREYEAQYEEFKRTNVLARLSDAELNQLADKMYEEDKANLEKLARSIKETENVRSLLYAEGIVYEKYRDLVPICTIYEYLESGRVATLTGSDGAYNLYESELRLNRIINRIDTIVNDLEQIKGNQYLLYNELTRINKNITKVQDELQQLEERAEQIQNNSAVAAEASWAAARNTEALAELEFYKEFIKKS